MSVLRRTTEDLSELTPRVRYEDDFYTWIGQQVALLRAGRFDEIDAENIAEELADVAKSEFNALESALTIVLLHMLKWEHQPERRGRSWDASIAEHRRRAVRLLKESPGMGPRLQEAVDHAYLDARGRASAETDRPRKAFPPACPYGFDEIMTRPFDFDPD